MRLNKFLALRSHLSRRGADEAIVDGRVTVNEATATLGQAIQQNDVVALDGSILLSEPPMTTIMMHKPSGYVCSRAGQGSRTVYDLLPDDLQHLNPIGRLDKDSSGLLLMTNDGELMNKLAHPRYEKIKVYEVRLDRPLRSKDAELIASKGVELEDGVSKLEIKPISSSKTDWNVKMHEGRNRQIRRTFEKLGYKISKLHRTNFGPHKLEGLKKGELSVIVT